MMMFAVHDGAIATAVESKAFVMPLDNGCGFYQRHGVEDLRLNSVKPNPKQPVGGEEPKLTRPLPAQGDHLMSRRDELKLQ
jgi:hypothetical protein